jgi:hypothetical protein
MNIQEIYRKINSLYPKYIVEIKISSQGIVVLLQRIDNKYQIEHSFYVDKCNNFEEIFNKELEAIKKYGN